MGGSSCWYEAQQVHSMHEWTLLCVHAAASPCGSSVYGFHDGCVLQDTPYL